MYIQWHYIVWQITSLITRTISHDNRKSSIYHCSNLPWVGVLTLWFKISQLILFTHHMWRTCWKVLVQCISDNVRFLLIIFKENCGSGFLGLTDMHHPQETHCSLHIKVLPVKLKIQYFECVSFRLSSAWLLILAFSFNMPHEWKSHGFRCGIWGDHNSLLIVL